MTRKNNSRNKTKKGPAVDRAPGKNSSKSRSDKSKRRNRDHVKRTNDHNRRRVNEARAVNDRTVEERHDDFELGSLLDAPPAPEGTVYKWLAYEVNGEISKNYFINQRYGWKPVDPDTVENLEGYQCIEYEDGTQVISIGRCMVLCENSEAKANKVARKWERRALGETRSNRKQGLNSFWFDGENVGVYDKGHDSENFSSENREVLRLAISSILQENGYDV